MVDAFECPARADTVFISTPATNCKVIFVCLREWSVTFGKLTFASVLCSHTLNNPGDISVPFSVQNNLSVFPSLSPRYFFWFSHHASYSFKQSSYFIPSALHIFSVVSIRMQYPAFADASIDIVLII